MIFFRQIWEHRCLYQSFNKSHDGLACGSLFREAWKLSLLVINNHISRKKSSRYTIIPESAICNMYIKNLFLMATYTERLLALAIDEVHCVKIWGDKFRTAFAHLGELWSLFPGTVHILALIATATSETFINRIVIQKLSIVNPTLIALPPCRDNITYKCTKKWICKHSLLLFVPTLLVKDYPVPR